MSESTSSENEMGNIVSGAKDLLSSSVHRPEGDKEEEAGQDIPSETEQSSTTEPETVPEQPSTSDKQQSPVDIKDTKSSTSTSTTPKLQHNGSTDSGCDGSGGGGKQQCNNNNIPISDFLLRELLFSRGYSFPIRNKEEDEDDVILDEETRDSFPDEEEEDDLTILDMFIIKPESFKFKNRYNNNKKNNKRKRWFRSKKQRKADGKIHYIIF